MRKGSWGLIVTITLFPMLASASLGKVLPLIGDMAAAFHISAVAASWLISVIPLVAVLLAPFVGALGDRFGDRAMIVAGIAISIAGNAFDVIAPSFASLLVGRGIEGAGFIFLMTGVVAVMMRSAEGPRQGSAMALLGAAIPTGIGISEALGGLAAGPHWRYVFPGHAAFLLLALPVVAALPVWQRGARHAHAGTDPWAAYRLSKPLRLCLCLCLLTLAQFGVSAVYPTYLHLVFGMSLAIGALMGALGLFAGLLGNVSVSILLARGLQARTLALTGMAALAGFGILTFLTVLGSTFSIAASVIMLIGGGFTNGLLLAVLPRVAPDPAMRGRVSALSNQLNTTGLLLAPPIAFAAFAAAGGMGLLALVLVCVAIAFFIVPLARTAGVPDSATGALP